MDRYRQIVELSEDCIKEIDLDGFVTGVNGKGLKLLGAEHPSQVVSKLWRELWPVETRGIIDDALSSAKRGERVDFEALCPDFTGESKAWHVRVGPVVEAGEVVSILAISSDITRRNSAFAAAHVLQDALDSKSRAAQEQVAAAERRASQLASELDATKSRLMSTNSAYQELEVQHFTAKQGLDFAVAAQHAALMIAEQAQKGEAIGQLLAGAVHDLNNVLQSATTAIDFILQRGVVSEFDATLLGVAERALQHGAVMTQRLLGFAREHPYQPESVHLADLVEDMRPLLEQAVGTSARLSIIPTQAGCCAMVDRHTLERALMNLVINARDASELGGRIQIETGDTVVSPSEETIGKIPGGYVTLVVSDDGAGMSEEVQSRIFEVYFTTKEAGKGSGLGLAQVYAAVRQAGGFVEVNSAPGAGARIMLAFPKV